MRDEERFRLLYGPYYPPKTRRGRRLFDEIHGTVVVGTWSSGKICWPRRWRRRSLILCGDLVKAIRRESVVAIAHWWGVGTVTASRWRRALGVERLNEGTIRLKTAWGHEVGTPALARVQRVVPDPVISTRRARRFRKPGQAPPWGRQWTIEEESLLGTMPDRELAERLGCSPWVVGTRRKRLGIAASFSEAISKGTVAVSPGKLLARRLALRLGQRAVAKAAGIGSAHYGGMERGTTKATRMATIERLAGAMKCRPEDIMLRQGPRPRTIPDPSLLGKIPDIVLSRRWKIPLQTVRRRRLALGIPTFQSQRRPKLPDDSLLGTMSDPKLAAKFGIDRWWITQRRHKLGIPAHLARRTIPLPDESLLGTLPDAELARRWRLPVNVVGRRRRRLGIATSASQNLRLIGESLLGTQPDYKLAAQWGVSDERVRQRRQELGIPGFAEGRRLACAAQRLRDCRLVLGITQTEAAKRAGVGYNYYNNLERGRWKWVPRNTAEKIAAGINCRVEDFATPLVPQAESAEPKSHGTEALRPERPS